MADIKTRNAVEGRVKTIDRALIAGQHINNHTYLQEMSRFDMLEQVKTLKWSMPLTKLNKKQKKLPWMECINSIKADEMVLMSLRVT